MKLSRVFLKFIFSNYARKNHCETYTVKYPRSNTKHDHRDYIGQIWNQRKHLFSKKLVYMKRVISAKFDSSKHRDLLM